MLFKKLKMIAYIKKRDKRIKFRQSEDKFTSLHAMKKAAQLLWKVSSKYLPIIQNASYCYSFIWTSGEAYEDKKYYVVDIYDDITYARILKNPAEIYNSPKYTDKIPYTKLYNNINRLVKNFINQKNTVKQYE